MKIALVYKVNGTSGIYCQALGAVESGVGGEDGFTGKTGLASTSDGGDIALRGVSLSNAIGCGDVAVGGFIERDANGRGARVERYTWP